MPNEKESALPARHIHPLMHVPVPWVFILAYLVGVGMQRLWPIAIREPTARLVSLSIGFSLLGTGVAVAFFALGLFKRRRTTTVPFEAPSTLVTNGPYRRSRNPMYVGLTLVYLGVAGLRVEIWPLIVLPLVLLYVHRVVIPVEEARLREIFGGAYDEYSARVRRWL